MSIPKSQGGLGDNTMRHRAVPAATMIVAASLIGITQARLPRPVRDYHDRVAVEMSAIALHDTNANPNVASDCQKAVNLLNKSTINNGKKMASDPAFNLAAQLLAAQLNFTAGAAKNGTVITAVNQAVLLLGKYKFDGITHTAINAADAATMNNLAKILDNYNNNI
jgi:hypothetical protein